MKAITTRYVGQTDRLPARIIASDQDGNRVTVQAGGDFPYDDVHRAAAVALCTKMSWPGADTLIEGSVKHGRVFVFAPEHRESRIANRERCPECDSTEGAYVPPGSGSAQCLHCGADWPKACASYSPDHNGECLNCDEPASEHEGQS